MVPQVVLSIYRTRLHPASTYHGIPTLPPYPSGGGLSLLRGGIHIHLRPRRHIPIPIEMSPSAKSCSWGWGEGWSVKLHQEHYNFFHPPPRPQPQEELDHYTININMVWDLLFGYVMATCGGVGGRIG